MLPIKIPEQNDLKLEHLVCDFNGTLAVDGVLTIAIARALDAAGANLKLHLLTADTAGTVTEQVKKVKARVQLVIVRTGREKDEYVARLGASKTVCLGNGRNDAMMLRSAALAIVILGEEGAAREAILEADIVCRSPEEALALVTLGSEKRLVAGLRL